MGRSYRAIWMSAAVALAVLAVGALVVFSWRHRLPDPMAVHWGASGNPDGFASVTGFIATMAGVLSGVVALFAGLGLAVGKSATGKRLMVGGILYIGFFGALLLALTASIQLGIASAEDAAMPGWVLGASLLAPLLPASAGAALVRRAPVPDAAMPPAPDAPRVSLIDGRVPPWRGHSTANPAGSAIMLLLLIATFAWIGLAAGSWLLGLLGIALGVLASLGLAFTIEADQDGLTVRSWAGWPRKRIPARQIENAEAAMVEPFQEFGGWGYRIGFGGIEGIVVRKGPGIRIRYGDGLVLVVTVNQGAELGAATLNAAAMRAYDHEH